MKTVRHLIHREVFQAVAFVALGFLSLFMFFDLVDELQHLNRLAPQGYTMGFALLVVVSKAPGHLYDLLPIAVLIGTIFVMARLAQSSEFTILRTGGLGPGRALWLLLQAGWIFVALTYALGDYVSPWAEQQGILLKSRFRGELTAGRTGAWLKEKQGDQQVAVNIRAMDDQARMLDIRIHRFDAQGSLISTLHARRGEFGDELWRLQEVEAVDVQAQPQHSALHTRTLAQLDWPTGISRDMVGAALISADRMKIWDLIVYTRHLSQNQQSAQQYEIQLWRKVFYPLSCLVMLTLALPFAYLHFRSGQIATHVFGGVMAGISFYLLNNVFSHVGNLRDWEPWITSAAPSLIYTVISLAAFGWMVLRR
ncbi:MAG: Lipopolysaccharide export system permease protein LptG [Pseudomonadota bacterium]|jgi:lipopolysaccharide export system permease protein